MYQSLGIGLCELLWVLGRPRRSLGGVAHLSDDLSRLLANAASASLGVVLATAHTGNWDLSACALARAGFPLTLVSKRLRVGWLDRYWQTARAREGIDIVHGWGSFARTADAIRRGRHVALIIDQAPERHSAVCTAPFLGTAARCDLTPALLAARTGATLALVLGHRAEDGTHRVELVRAWPPPARAGLKWAAEVTRAQQDELSAFVRKHPPQWLWLHRRWKGAGGAPGGLRDVAPESLGRDSRRLVTVQGER